MCTGWSYSPDDFPRQPEEPELRHRNFDLQTGEQLVFLITQVLAEHLDESIEIGLAFGGVPLHMLEPGYQFIYFLMLKFNLQGEFVPIGENPSHDRPKN
jgi:hypothetical protein